MPAWWRSSCGSPCRDGSVFTKNKNAGLTSSVFSATIHLAFAGVAHLVERDLAKVEVASSSLVARSKKERHPHGCLSFLEQHFCCAKVVACGRVIERERGNPSKVPPSHSPFLAMCGSADNKTCGQSHKSPPIWVVIFFAFSPALTVVSAGSQPLPRPAVRTLPRNRLASSAAGGASALSSMQKRLPSARWKPFRMLRQFRCRR